MEGGDSRSGNGGGAVGLSIPIGGHGKDPPPPQNPIPLINISLPANPDSNVANLRDVFPLPEMDWPTERSGYMKERDNSASLSRAPREP
jgi:hypothetical protein